MKKIISSCSVLAMLACGTALAGGPDMMPPMPACFEGFSIGIEGAFWQSNFGAYDAGRIFCKGVKCKTDDFSVVLLGPAQFFSGLSSSNTSAAVIAASDFSFDSHFADNGNGFALSGAIGVQVGYGKVLHNLGVNNFYVGINGFADLGDASDTITSQARNLEELLDYSTKGFPGGVTSSSSGEFFFSQCSQAGVNDPVDVITAAGSVYVNTHVSMDNLYGIAAKVGYLFAPNALAYVKGGVAWSDINVDTDIITNFDFPDRFEFANKNARHIVAHTGTSDTEAGWLVGVGAEYCLTEHFTINGEYNFVDFDNISAGPGKPHHLTDEPVENIIVSNVTGVPQESATILDPRQLTNATAVQATEAKTDLKVSAFKVGVNYYFNFM